MIFNCVSISLHKKNKFTLYFLRYLLLLVKFDWYIIFPFFYRPLLSHFQFFYKYWSWI